jgi:hypothetical protein
MNGVVHEFDHSGLSFPDVFKDANGDSWNAFGEGPEADKDLQPVNNLIGYWFAFPSFHKKIILANGEEIVNPSFGTENPKNEWLVDRDFVFGGSIRDGIKSIDNPLFFDITSKVFQDDNFYKQLEPDELLTMVKVGNEIKLYPHRIFEYHEIVNDIIDGQPIAISFCPLTGTSRAWHRMIDGEIREFGVSGLLFNNNLILYDRMSGTNWSQIFDKAVNGPLIGNVTVSVNTWEVRVTDILDVTGGRVKLLSTNTGIQYDYQYSVYGDYKYSDRISFPLQFSDDRIPPKERVIGVTVGEITKVYRMQDFK